MSIEAILFLCDCQLQHQICRGNESHFNATLNSLISKTDGQMTFSDAAWAKQHNIFTAFNKRQAGQFLQLFARCAGCKAEII